MCVTIRRLFINLNLALMIVGSLYQRRKILSVRSLYVLVYESNSVEHFQAPIELFYTLQIVFKERLSEFKVICSLKYIFNFRNIFLSFLLKYFLHMTQIDLPATAIGNKILCRQLLDDCCTVKLII